MGGWRGGGATALAQFEMSADADKDPSTNASGGAEDLLASDNAQIAWRANDSVRIKTAAHLWFCMPEGTTFPAWVLQMVILGSARAMVGPNETHIEQARRDMHLDHTSEKYGLCSLYALGSPAASPISCAHRATNASLTPRMPLTAATPLHNPARQQHR